MFFMLVYILDTLFKAYFAQHKPFEHCSNAHIYVHLSSLHYAFVLTSVLQTAQPCLRVFVACYSCLFQVSLLSIVPLDLLYMMPVILICILVACVKRLYVYTPVSAVCTYNNNVLNLKIRTSSLTFIAFIFFAVFVSPPVASMWHTVHIYSKK